MALNLSQIEADAKAIVLAELEEHLLPDPAPDPPLTTEQIFEVLADAVAKAVRVGVEAIRDTADVAGVTEGEDTVEGAII